MYGEDRWVGLVDYGDDDDDDGRVVVAAIERLDQHQIPRPNKWLLGELS